MWSFLYVYSDHSILECYNLFSGVELSMRSFFVISSDVTMVSNAYIFLIILFTTNVTPIHSYKSLFIILSHNQWFVELFLNDSFAVFNLFKHLFHEFVNGIFTSIRLNWFTLFVIIATYDLICTTTVFVSLIGFCV